MKLSKDEERWLKNAALRSGIGIEGSKIFLSLMSKSYKTDPLCALQLGIAILLNKPIAVLSIKGAEVPEALKKLAFACEEFSENNEPEMRAATLRILKKADLIKEH